MTSYGANYRDKGPENYRQSAIAVCSTLIPCEEFMQQGKDLKRLASRRKEEHAGRNLVSATGNISTSAGITQSSAVKIYMCESISKEVGLYPKPA